jgi:PmbA protein
MINERERLSLAEWAMNLALKSGASEAAVRLAYTRSVSAEVRDGNLDTLTEAQHNGLDLDVYVDGRYSSHSTNDLRADDLARFIREAVASTRYLSPDEYRGLPDPSYYPQDLAGDLKVFDPSYEEVETEERIKIARELEAEARAASDKIVTATGSYSDNRSDVVRVHSNGFVGGAQTTTFDIGVDATVADEGGKRPGDWSSSTARFRRDLLAPDYLAAEAATRALAKIGQQKIASGQYDCIVENRACRRLGWMLQEPLQGRALHLKASFLEGKMHQQVASEKFTLIDDPTIEKGLGSRFFDGEGLAAKVLPVFENGILSNYFIDVYYGRRLGMQPTTAHPSNYIVVPGERSLAEMIKDTARGILVQGFIGGNSNSTTGDFSLGISGELIENGRTVMPISEMNLAGNTGDLFSRLVEVGNDPYLQSSMRCPSLRFEGAQFSGI